MLSPITSLINVDGSPLVLTLILSVFILLVGAGIDKQNGHETSCLSFRPTHVWTSLLNRLRAWLFLTQGPSLIQKGYNKGAAKQIIQPQYTLHEFDWSELRGKDGTPLVRTLRVLLTNALPSLMGDVRRAMEVIIDRGYETGGLKNGIKSPALFPMIIESIAYCNALAFFGKEIAYNEKFVKASVGFIENTLIASEIVRVLPRAIAPAVGKFLAARFASQHIMFDTLIPIAEQRLEEYARKKLGHEVPVHKDCIQWVMENSPKSNPWSAERIVHELMALWFGSVHITSTTTCFAIHDLCLRPEYIPILRQEIESTGWDSFDQFGGQTFALLDSFIKESARTTPVEALSTRRMALQPYYLSETHRVEPGEWVCTPPKAMAADPTYYADPLEFHGFRFVKPELLNEQLTKAFRAAKPKRESQLTNIDDWQLWGTGRCACPGRFYAAAIMKMMLALFITKWDMELEDSTASRSSIEDHSKEKLTSQQGWSSKTFAPFVNTSPKMPSLHHLPALLVATSETFGGVWPLFNAQTAILAFGLPSRIADSPAAQSIMLIASSRITTIGLIIYVLYHQEHYAAVDSVLAVMGLYAALMDGFVCWRESVPRMAVFRSFCALTVAWFGLTGWTAG
ncbi:hypothetical protein NPX13_g1438 [Xylaria arbuscula]|uniref:Cytochrome P450 n=1 Tax=Xylaria arbuscula TaxID=114810 RepID=A0A9W8NMQ4_9PEZI|nr:hypothetical protein NPX13_g1438 [Xylaria arbuscula]